MLAAMTVSGINHSASLTEKGKRPSSPLPLLKVTSDGGEVTSKITDGQDFNHQGTKTLRISDLRFQISKPGVQPEHRVLD
jgi:hypothetical protein